MLTASHGRENGRNLTLLAAFCLFLSAVEYMIPKPLPFMRIGLANLPLMLALGIFPLRSFFVLVCVKVFGQALITGTLFSYIFLFSMTGTFLSAMVMYFLRFALGREHVTFIGIGTAGAVVSNLSQLSLARVFIFQENTVYIAPLFIAAGLVTGIVLGIFCEVFSGKSRWYQNNFYYETAETKEKEEKTIIHKKSSLYTCTLTENFYNYAIGAKALFFTGLLIIPALLFNPSTEYRVLLFLFFWLLVWLADKKTNFIFTVLIILFIVVFNLIIPYGRVLYSIGAFKITKGALEAGIHRAVTLQALVFLSKAAIRQDLKIPGAFGKLLSESLRMFSDIMSRKYQITGKNIMSQIDNLLIELSSKEFSQPTEQQIHTKPAGYFILIAVVILSWMPWIFNSLY